jgi:hypothetical protein
MTIVTIRPILPPPIGDRDATEAPTSRTAATTGRAAEILDLAGAELGIFVQLHDGGISWRLSIGVEWRYPMIL